jgi:HD-GYP domain-containing protein (c-di-GMP phosphodiesterase class II)
MSQNPIDLKLMQKLLRVGALLSSEKDIDQLLENILEVAMSLCNADGGSVYRLTEEQTLKFEILHTKSKGAHLGGKSGIPIPFPPIAINKPDGSPEMSRVVCYAVHQDETVNIPDAYNATGFDFSGTKIFDEKNNYRSQSFLTVPMKNHESEIIGVMQLINATDEATGKIIPFSASYQEIVEGLASQAAVALTNRLLINRLEELFESFIGIINHAIDDKSPYTSGHCSRVPDLTVMLADAVNRANAGPLKDFSMNEVDRHELKIAGLLHDCGKITTPVHIVDKATKLEAIFDRIALIDLRADIIMRDIELAKLTGKLDEAGAKAKQEKLSEDVSFLQKCNFGGEFMANEDIERVKTIATTYEWVNSSGDLTPFLSADEIKNLTIRAGTLTEEDRQIINHHIEVTIGMLERLPWPKHLKNVPEYAGGHHERMDGKGYPKGLTREQMSVQARCMAIADVFEALTASDRPYKKGKKLSESLEILGKMKLGSHIDPDLFDIFIWEKVYEQYALQFLPAEQIDVIDVNKIPGYNPPPENYYRTH